jgi:hypothetical protein
MTDFLIGPNAIELLTRRYSERVILEWRVMDRMHANELRTKIPERNLECLCCLKFYFYHFPCMCDTALMVKKE